MMRIDVAAPQTQVAHRRSSFMDGRFGAGGDGWMGVGTRCCMSDAVRLSQPFPLCAQISFRVRADGSRGDLKAIDPETGEVRVQQAPRGVAAHTAACEHAHSTHGAFAKCRCWIRSPDWLLGCLPSRRRTGKESTFTLRRATQAGASARRCSNHMSSADPTR